MRKQLTNILSIWTSLIIVLILSTVLLTISCSTPQRGPIPTFGPVPMPNIKAESWTTFTTDDGLAHDYVRSIAEDSEGNLWFATGNGVNRLEIR